MSSIDERVVEMKFNNGQFESGVKTSVSSLDKLKQSLNLDGASKSLDNLQSTGNRFSLQGIANGVEGIGAKFTALGVVGVTALATIANQAINVGEKLVSSLTIDPIKQGLDEYNTNLNAIQTVLANTQSSGATLKDVNAALNDLNHYSDKTIYNFSEMAKNIGTFTAAGVDLKTSTSAIKGIANLAALSGSNSEQASTAMYQLSQAISAGKVGLQDWNSVVNAGMGGTVFQRALAETAVKMGTVDDSAVKLTGKMKNVTIAGQSFRNSLSDPKTKGWLTSKVLTETLSHFTGDLKDSQLAAEGFSKAEIKAIQAQAKTALQAATVVKTLPQLMNTLQESVGSGWTQTWQYIFGDFDQAKKLFTGVYNTLNPLVQASANSRNKILGDWEKGGGRTAAIKAVSDAFKALMNVVNPLKNAFTDVFPPTTGAQLITVTKAVARFADSLKEASVKYGPTFYRIFKGVFALLDIGRMVIGGFIKTIAGLFGGAGKGASSFLELAARLGDFLVKLDLAVKNGKGLETFFKGLGNVLQVPIGLIGALVGAVLDLFLSFDKIGNSKFSDTLSNIGDKVKPLGAAGAVLAGVWARFGDALGRVLSFAKPIADKLATELGNLGTSIADGLSNGSFQPVLDTLNTGLLGGITLLIAKFFKNGFNFNFSADVGHGLFGSIKETFEGLTGTLQAMQTKLKAQTLLTIAAAIGILTVSVVALSLIDSDKLTKALTAITVMFTQLGTALAIFTKISAGPGFAKLPVMAAGLILLAIAIDVLAIAVKKLSGIDFPGLLKGLGGVLILLGGLAATANLVKGASIKLLPVAAGMILVAIAVNILAKAVASLSKLDTGALVQGLIGVGVILATLAGFTKLIGNPAGLISTGLGLILVGTALQLMAKGVAALGALSIETIAKGLFTMGAALAIIGLTMKLMPTNMILSAAALVIVAAALNLMADALISLGGMSLDEIGKSLGVLAASLVIVAASLILMTEALPGAAALIVAAAALVIMAPALKAFGDLSADEIGKAIGTLAASLIIIAASMILMTEALPGALALIVVAAALTILAPVLVTLGSMSWEEIGKGLLVLAASLAIIGVAGLLLTPVIPTLIGLGVAVALLGVGLALAGAGVFLFATGLAALGAAGAVGAAGLTVAFSAILGLIPLAMKKIGEGLVALAGAIGDGAPAIVKAIVKVVSSLLDALGVLIPKGIKLILKLVVALANGLANSVPKLYRAGYKLLIGILTAIGDNIGKLITAGARVAIKFMQGIGNNAGKVADAGAKMVVKLVNGIADAIRNNQKAMNTAGARLGAAILSGMTGGISDHIGDAVAAASRMAHSVIDTVARVIDSHSPSKEFIKLGGYVAQGFAIGITDGTKDQVASALTDMSDQIAALISSTQSDMDSFVSKISSTKEAITKDTAAIVAQRKVVATAKADRKSGKIVDEDTVKLGQLTAARAKDTANIKKYQKASTASYKKDGTAKRTQARLNLLSAKATLAANTQAIKEQKNKIKAAKADVKHGTSVKVAQDKLTALTTARTNDNKALSDAQNGLSDATDENKEATAAQVVYNAQLAASQDQLNSLAASNDDLTDQIKTQTQAVADATKTRDDYNSSLQSQYSTLSDIATDTSVSDYFDNLEDQVTKVNEFATNIQELRNRGLNDTAYTKLLAEGTDASGFVDQLLAMGQDGVAEFDSLTDQLASASASLGTTASTNLYQAGVNAAQGLLDGLNDKQSAIQAQMTAIAESMVAALKSALDINSPSRVFARLGGYAGEGLVTGLTASAKAVSNAAGGLGDAALDGLKSSISSISDAVSDQMDLQPTITPILDLSGVQASASTVAGLFSGTSISASAALGSAVNASNGYNSNQQAIIDAKEQVAGSVGGSGITYIQNNNSPVALSAVEIYRQTKNQLSVVKGG